MGNDAGRTIGAMPKVLILGGFLGSGKTTLLLQLAAHVKAGADSEVPVAIIENEIGEVGIDDDSIGGAGYEVTSIVSGCACCTLKAELTGAIRQIAADLAPELIVVEATGVAVPEDMAANIVDYANADVRICALVDASRWRRIHVALQQVLDQQLVGADIICVNKCDLVDEAEIAFIDETLEEFAPTADILHVSARSALSVETYGRIMGPWVGGEPDVSDSATGAVGSNVPVDEEAPAQHAHLHHHHHRGEGAHLKPARIANCAVAGEVRARHHEGSAVAFAVLYPQSADEVSFGTVVDAMMRLAADVESLGGVVGHVKASADDGKQRMKASIVAAGQNPDVSGVGSGALGKRHVVKLVAIAVGVEADQLQAVMVTAIEGAFETSRQAGH